MEDDITIQGKRGRLSVPLSSWRFLCYCAACFAFAYEGMGFACVAVWLVALVDERLTRG